MYVRDVADCGAIDFALKSKKIRISLAQKDLLRIFVGSIPTPSLHFLPSASWEKCRERWRPEVMKGVTCLREGLPSVEPEGILTFT